MREKGKRAEKQRAEEYALLVGEISGGIIIRVENENKVIPGATASSILEKTHMFVYGVNNQENNIYFSIWYIDSSNINKMSYLIKNEQIVKEGITDFEREGQSLTVYYSDRNDIEPEENEIARGPLPVGLEELRMVARLVSDPLGNGEIADRLPRLPRE